MVQFFVNQMRSLLVLMILTSFKYAEAQNYFTKLDTLDQILASKQHFIIQKEQTINRLKKGSKPTQMRIWNLGSKYVMSYIFSTEVLYMILLLDMLPD